MMTQLFSIGTAQIDSVPQRQDHTFATLTQATQSIVEHAFYLAQEKQRLSKKEYKQLLHSWGWDVEDKKYLKIAKVFSQFSPEDLAQIEPSTLFLLANNSKKYQPVLDKLLDLGEITQQRVQELIEEQRKPKKPKSEKPSIWRSTSSGVRYCQIPPIHDQETGVALQNMMDEEGLTAQAIIKSALSLRQAYKEGRLILVEDASQLDDLSSSSKHEVESDSEQDFEVDEDCSADNFPQNSSSVSEQTITCVHDDECDRTTPVNAASSTVISDVACNEDISEILPQLIGCNCIVFSSSSVDVLADKTMEQQLIGFIRLPGANEELLLRVCSPSHTQMVQLHCWFFA
ncbi:hypothetical protein [Iningainema tapete]|uniref:hypothetical protein n=1 Tax=Iningainema tapete TaxID=2806730 RepID=UPI0030806719